MSDLTISFTRGCGRSAKTRQFSQRHLGHLLADWLWEAPASHLAPIWMAYAGTRQEARAFNANLRSGQSFAMGHKRFRIAAKAGYRWSEQDLGGGVVATVVDLPELFDLEPTTAFCDRVRFVFAPTAWWLARHSSGDGAGAASLFAAYVDRRSPLPILPQARFRERLFEAAQEEPWFERFEDRGHLSGELETEGIALSDVAAVNVDHDTFAAFLAQHTHAFLEEENAHGPLGFSHDRRLLPDTATSPGQLRLAFEVAG